MSAVHGLQRAGSSAASLLRRPADALPAAAPEAATARLQSVLQGLRARPRNRSGTMQQPGSAAHQEPQQEPGPLLETHLGVPGSGTDDDALEHLWPRWPDQAAGLAPAEQQPDGSQLMALLDDPALADWASGGWLAEGWAAEAPQPSMLEPAMSAGGLTQQARGMPPDGTLGARRQTEHPQPATEPPQLSRGSAEQQEAVLERRGRRRVKQPPPESPAPGQHSSDQSALLSIAQPDEPGLAPRRPPRRRKGAATDAPKRSQTARKRGKPPGLAPVRTGRAGGLSVLLEPGMPHAWLLRLQSACAGGQRADGRAASPVGGSFGGITQGVIQAAARSSAQGAPPVFRLEELHRVLPLPGHTPTGRGAGRAGHLIGNMGSGLSLLLLAQMQGDGALRGVSRSPWSVTWDAHVVSPRSGVWRELAALRAHTHAAAAGAEQVQSAGNPLRLAVRLQMHGSLHAGRW